MGKSLVRIVIEMFVSDPEPVSFGTSRGVATPVVTPKKKDILEHEIYNPLGVRVGDTLSIPCLPFVPESKGLEVTEVDEWSRKIGDNLLLSTDYVCCCQVEGEDRWLTVRVNPRDNNPKEVDVLVLIPDWEEGYNEKFHKEELPSGVYRVRDPEDRRRVKATFNRVGGLSTPFNVTVREVKVSAEVITSYRMQLWNFVRELPAEDGGGPEFYFVEMEVDWQDDSKSTGQTRTYVARPIPSTEIEVIPTAAAREQQQS